MARTIRMSATLAVSANIEPNREHSLLRENDAMTVRQSKDSRSYFTADSIPAADSFPLCQDGSIRSTQFRCDPNSLPKQRKPNFRLQTPGRFLLWAALVVGLCLSPGRQVLGQNAVSKAGDSSDTRAEIDADLSRYEMTLPAMGVQFRLVIYTDDDNLAQRASVACRELLEKLEQASSDYRADSEIRRLCGSAPHPEPVKVSPELCELFELSRRVSNRSQGAFDVTVGPIVQLWRVARKARKLPADENLRAALALCGGDKVAVNPDAGTVALSNRDMRIDFGGIGKGFAADKLLSLLSGLGIQSALVDASGDIAVSQAPPGRDAWRVEVARLDDESQRQTLNLVNAAVATSGDAFQVLELDGKRYSHIVDPRTGQAVEGRRSVTVIAPTAAEADAFASAINVAGFSEALSWRETGIEFQSLELLGSDSELGEEQADAANDQQGKEFSTRVLQSREARVLERSTRGFLQFVAEQ